MLVIQELINYEFRIGYVSFADGATDGEIEVVTGPLLQIKIFLLSLVISTQLQRHSNVKVGSGELFLLSLSEILY
jgi:hypothetical protein